MLDKIPMTINNAGSVPTEIGTEKQDVARSHNSWLFELLQAHQSKSLDTNRFKGS